MNELKKILETDKVIAIILCIQFVIAVALLILTIILMILGIRALL